MTTNIIVANSTSLNKDGFQFALTALEQALFENCQFGVPYLVEHDQHRLLGLTIPFGLYIESKLSRQVSQNLIASNEKESRYFQAIREKIYQEKLYNEDFNKKKEILKEKLNSIDTTEGYFDNNQVVCYISNKVIHNLYPYLADCKDKDGLIPIHAIFEYFEYIGNGAFKHKSDGLIIFCHSYFRRSLSRKNHFHTYFLNAFFSLKDQGDITLRIALDEDNVGLHESYHDYFELDYWFGPQYNDDITNLPSGITRHESNERQKLFSQISGMDFWWKLEKEEHLKTLEAEEIREHPSLGIGEDQYGCRYVHSIFDTSKSRFDHFDGAIRIYDEDKIMSRWECNINKAGKDTNYKKLFRIDGNLKLEDWKSLTTLFYHGNPLIYEYFGAESPTDETANSAIPTQLDVSQKLIPYSINESDGLKVFVTYGSKKTDNYKKSRVIHSFDTIHSDERKIDVLEYDILEIKKVLSRWNEDLELPANIQFIKPDDSYTNYPIIYHYGEKLDENIAKTLEAYKLIFSKQIELENRSISFGFGWEMDDKLVTLSFYGKISEALKWIKNDSNPPSSRKEFRHWLNKMSDWLSINYQEPTNKEFINMITEDGDQFIKRTPIEPGLVKDLEADEIGLRYNIEIPKTDVELSTAIEQKLIRPAHTTLLRKVLCSKTGEDYLTSNSSKYLDDTTMAIKQCDLLGFFWTDQALI